MEIRAHFMPSILKSDPRLITKTLRVMKLTALILLSFCFHLSAKTVAQNVSLSFSEVSLEMVFKAIEKQTNYTFFFKQELLEKGKKVSIDLKAAPLTRALDVCFSNQPFTYSIDGKIITITPTPELIRGLGKKDFSHPNLPPIKISGIVVGINNQPLAGATIRVKGKNIIAVSNEQGYFELNAEIGSTLVISYVGFLPAEIVVSANNIGNVWLQPNASNLQEIVINKGYYVESKRLTTGSIGRVTSKEIEKQPVSNPLAGLIGRVPGLQITQQTGLPGGGFTVRIRGQNSLSNGNDPLYIVDGVPFSSTPMTNQQTGLLILGGFGTNPLNYLNSSDISSIEVLKDADATAIYGSRGANGVILITTKKGKAGETNVEINAYTGMGKVNRKMDLLNRRQYLDMRYEALMNDGISLTASTPNTNDLNKWDTSRSTDWQKELIGGTARVTSVQGALSGGNEHTTFRLGIGYLRETSVFKGDFSDLKTSAHLAVNHLSLNRRLKSQVSISYLIDNNNLPNSDLTNQALRLPPIAPSLFEANGKLNWQNSTWTNPATYLYSRYRATTNNLISNATLSYQIIEGLELRASSGYTYTSVKELNLTPLAALNPSTSALSSAQFGSNGISTWIAEPQLEYVRKKRKSRLSILAAASFQQSISESLIQTGRGFSSDALIENIQAATTVTQNSYDYKKYRYSGIFSRINYIYNNKYMINFTGRRDGSSRFGPGKQFANFGSVGVGYIFSEETYVKSNFHFLSFGKLRMSYGTSGNDQLKDYEYLSTYIPSTSPYLGSGLIPSSLTNFDFRWEVTRKMEGSIELGFFDDALFFSVSHYRNKSSNQLVGYSLAPTAGFPNVQYNLPAVVQNTGWEFEISSINIKSKKFSWKTDLSFTIPRNKLVEYQGIESSSNASKYIVGQPLSIQILFNGIHVDSNTGLYAVRDYNNDGRITSSDDRKAFINVGQKYFAGLHNKLQYRNLELDFFIQVIKQTGRNYIPLFLFPGYIFNQPVEVVNRWRKAGDNALVQKFSQNTVAPATAYSLYSQSTAGYGDASFARLKNISISWQLSNNIKKLLKIEDGRIYIQGQNLFTITNFTGLDPENNSVNSLPPLAMLTAGFQVKF